VRWATRRAHLGWDLKGIWPVGSDGSDVLAVDVSRGAGVIQVRTYPAFARAVRSLLRDPVPSCCPRRAPAQTVATADAHGHVKLFRHPCCGDAPVFRAFIGHAAQAHPRPPPPPPRAENCARTPRAPRAGGRGLTPRRAGRGLRCRQVANLTFTEDNVRLLSTGGRDACVFQWRYVPKFPDVLPTPAADPDLRALTVKPLREERQLRRRAAVSRPPARSASRPPRSCAGSHRGVRPKTPQRPKTPAGTPRGGVTPRRGAARGRRLTARRSCACCSTRRGRSASVPAQPTIPRASQPS
jgi:hypothetical protein